MPQYTPRDPQYYLANEPPSLASLSAWITEMSIKEKPNLAVLEAVFNSRVRDPVRYFSREALSAANEYGKLRRAGTLADAPTAVMLAYYVRTIIENRAYERLASQRSLPQQYDLFSAECDSSIARSGEVGRRQAL